MKNTEKIWDVKSAKYIETGSCDKNFEMSDEHLELQHVSKSWTNVIMIGIFFALVVAELAEFYGGIASLLILVLLLVYWWGNKMFSEKMSKDLHFICCTEHPYDDSKPREYFAIDIKTNELLYVRYIFDGANYIFIETDLESLKKYIASKSAYYYGMIKDITSETIELLKDIQFGENKWRWVWFTKQKVKEMIKIGCIGIEISGDCYVKFAELTLDDYNHYFENCSKVEDVYRAFMNKKCIAFKDNRIRCFSRRLNRKENEMLVNIMMGDEKECNVLIERYMNVAFIEGDVHIGNACVIDMKLFEFLKYLSFGKKVDEFVPTVMVEEQTLKECNK